MTTNITVLQQLLVVNLDVHIWSARKKLTAVDLSDTNLPPEELASLGSKRICNPEELRAFSMLKARAIALLERNGIRFLSGWAVPEAKMDAISNELASIGNEFRACKESCTVAPSGMLAGSTRYTCQRKSMRERTYSSLTMEPAIMLAHCGCLASHS